MKIVGAENEEVRGTKGAGQRGGKEGEDCKKGMLIAFYGRRDLLASSVGDHATGSPRALGTQVYPVTTRAPRAERDYNDPRLRVTEATWPNRMRAVQQYMC